MTTKTSPQQLPQLSFAKLETGMPMPHLLDIQTLAFKSLLQPDGKDGVRSDVGALAALAIGLEQRLERLGLNIEEMGHRHPRLQFAERKYW